MAAWAWLALSVVLTVRAAADQSYLELTDEEYYLLPELFMLDEWERCMVAPGALYCEGRLLLAPDPAHNDSISLFHTLQEFSKNPENFNHSVVHRGVCVSRRCPDLVGASDALAACANRSLHRQYHLHALPLETRYCQWEGEGEGHAVDRADLAFLCVCVLLLLLNALGTAYDVLTARAHHKQSSGLVGSVALAWSVRASWRRLTAPASGSEPRLDRLRAIQGIKVFLINIVIGAHWCLLAYSTYVYNPRFLELGARDPGFIFVYNGSMVVQTFFVISSFLLGYNLLIYFETHPHFQMSVFFKSIINRLIRISPAYWLVWGWAATWARHTGGRGARGAAGGPLWAPLMQTEAWICRDKWWTHLLYVNNLVDPDRKCLTQTWFLAADMQLYVVSCALMMVVWRWRGRAALVLGGSLVAALVLLLGLVYSLHLQPALFLQQPERMRVMFEGEASFNLLYVAPWGSLPAALLGLLLAHLHYATSPPPSLSPPAAAKPTSVLASWIVSWWCRGAAVVGVCWVLGGVVLRHLSSRAAVSFYALAERPVFAFIAATIMYSAFNRRDGWVRRVVEWRGFVSLGRLTLSALLVHWSVARAMLASKHQPMQVSILSLMGECMSCMVLSYVCATPLALLVELPAARTLRLLLSRPPAPPPPHPHPDATTPPPTPAPPLNPALANGKLVAAL